MTGANSKDRVLAAPETLGLESRAEFRQRAVRLLEELPEGEGRLVVDLARTNRVDSAGLGALMLVQRRAGERRQRVALRNASEEIRFLLALTKLLDLFEIDIPTR
jgi:anti-anti-sigma regulatory factor